MSLGTSRFGWEGVDGDNVRNGYCINGISFTFLH
jgi:hypothetical protein